MGANLEITNDDPVILFDGVCNLCNASVNFIIDRDPRGIFRFSSLQSNFGKNEMKKLGQDPSLLSSIVLLAGNKVFIKSTAALKIAKELSGPISWVYIFIFLPNFIRDFVYDIIARNRYRWFGRSDECRVPSINIKHRFLA